MSESVATPVWYLRGRAFGSGLYETTAHANTNHADGVTVMTGDPQADQLWSVRATDVGIAHIDVTASDCVGAPAVWFVVVEEPAGPRPAVNLVAYPLSVLGDSPALPAGTVISANRFPLMGVANDAQIGAIRWYPDSGLIHQIYVRPDARRQSLGSLMLYSASAFHQAKAWPGRLHADGRRTDLGEQFAAGMRFPHRLMPLTETQPPMD